MRLSYQTRDPTDLSSTVYVEADMEMRKSDPIDGQNVPDRVFLRQREWILPLASVSCGGHIGMWSLFSLTMQSY